MAKISCQDRFDHDSHQFDCAVKIPSHPFSKDTAERATRKSPRTPCLIIASLPATILKVTIGQESTGGTYYRLCQESVHATDFRNFVPNSDLVAVDLGDQLVVAQKRTVELCEEWVMTISTTNNPIRIIIACVSFFICLCIGCGHSGGFDPYAFTRIQGTWRQTLLNDEGKRFINEDEFLEWDSKCTITDHQLIWQTGVRRNVSVHRYWVDITKTPWWIDWDSNGQTARGIFKIEGDVLSICIGAKRPLDFDPAGSPSENLFVFRRTDSSPVEAVMADRLELNKVAANFEKAVINGDSIELQRIERQYRGLKSDTKSKRFMEFLKHPDQRVRMAVVGLFCLSEPGSDRVTVEGPVFAALLRMVGDQQLAPTERQAIVTAVLHAKEESERQQLYELLSELGEAGQFAVPALAAFIADKQHRHWSPGGSFDAPLGALELLASWGPASSEAVPDLIVALDHPNQYDFVPKVAQTLGAIGKPAKAAIVHLQRLQKSRRQEVREAAKMALEQFTGSETRSE